MPSWIAKPLLIFQNSPGLASLWKPHQFVFEFLNSRYNQGLLDDADIAINALN